jgi:hypothetical protein
VEKIKNFGRNGMATLILRKRNMCWEQNFMKCQKRGQVSRAPGFLKRQKRTEHFPRLAVTPPLATTASLVRAFSVHPGD